MKKTLFSILILVLLVASIVVAPISYADPLPNQTLFDEINTAYATYSEGKATLFGFYFDGVIEVNVLLYHESFKDTNHPEQNPAVEVMTHVNQIFVDVNKAVNTHVEGSDVYNFNNAPSGATISISDHTANLIKTAKMVYSATNGAYNPAVYRLVDLWGFSSRTYMMRNLGVQHGGQPYDRDWYRNDDGRYSYPLPDQKYIDAFKQLCDFDKVILGGEEGCYTLTKSCPDVTVDGVSYGQMLDFGGIAKGYVCDLIEKYWRENGYTQGYVNCGTSSFVLLQTQTGDSFEVGLQNPSNLAQQYSILRLKDVTLSTSGQTIRRYTTDGVTYSHIIDASTGRPANTGIVTTNAIGATSAIDDCLTTALTVFTFDQIKEFYQSDFVRENDIKCIAVHKQDGVHRVLTNIDQSEFVPLEKNFYFSDSLDDGLGKKGCNSIVLSTPLSFLLVAFLGIFARKKDLVFKAQKSKLFSIWDLLLYGLVLAIVIILFAVFVFSPQQALDGLEIVDQTNGQVVLTVDFSNKTYRISPNYAQNVLVEKTGEIYQFTISRQLNGELCTNVVEVSLQNGNQYAKMIEANCPTHDCINLFEDIVANDQAIVCAPHRLKIVSTTTSGEGIII